MISAQKSVEFDNSDYDNIKPVRSIWICMDEGIPKWCRRAERIVLRVEKEVICRVVE